MSDCHRDGRVEALEEAKDPVVVTRIDANAVVAHIDRVKHIARHDVEPYEVWEACGDPLHLARRQGQSRYRLYGQTAAGRHLFVVLEHAAGAEFKPITARDMTAREKQNFRRLRK